MTCNFFFGINRQRAVTDLTIKVLTSCLIVYVAGNSRKIGKEIISKHGTLVYGEWQRHDNYGDSSMTFDIELSFRSSGERHATKSSRRQAVGTTSAHGITGHLLHLQSFVC